MNVAILGVGTVGEAVARILLKNKKLIAARGGEEIVPVVGVVRNLNKKRDDEILIIGPEGGFSEDETAKFKNI